MLELLKTCIKGQGKSSVGIIDWFSLLVGRKLPILHFHKSHNEPLLSPKILHNHCLQFLLGHEDVPGEIENNAYETFFGGKEVYYGISASRELRTTLPYLRICSGSRWQCGGMMTTSERQRVFNRIKTEYLLVAMDTRVVRIQELALKWVVSFKYLR